MGFKKLLSHIHFRPTPPMILNSFHCPQNYITPQTKPFLPKGSTELATDLLKSYYEKGLTKEARKVFDEMPDRDVVAWTAMIAGYISCSQYTYAWTMFCEMLKTDICPNAFTFSSVLKACKGMECPTRGSMVHGLVIKKNGIEGSTYVDNALIDMYATCCASMDSACLIFRGMEVKNAVSWTTMIAGFTHKGDGYAGLQIFREMLVEEAELNAYSFSIAVRACATIGSQSYGMQIHAAIMKWGFEHNLPVRNSILDMYCRCGCLSEANQYFHEMKQKDLITWNTLISGYERSDSSESLSVFSQMMSEGCTPNCVTFTSVIAACSGLAVLSCGQQVHGGVISRGFERNLALSNALIDMYAKCGNITDSHKIFRQMSDRDLLSWTSMMIGYGAHGHGKAAVELFDEMVRSGVRPDKIVFVAVLSACSHAGLVDEGMRYFKSLVGDYKILPNHEIYGCLVDLLGRAGRVEEAYQLIESMPFEPDESIWGALLGACKLHKLPELGKLAALRISDLRPKMAGTYVMLSNIYAAEGKWGEFAKMRKLMRGMKSKKEAGRSWIEVKNQVYSFVVGDKMCSDIELVYGVVEWLIHHMKEVGYVPDIGCLIYDSEDWISSEVELGALRELKLLRNPKDHCLANNLKSYKGSF